MGSDTKKAFWEEKNTGFEVSLPEHDFLHPQVRGREPGPSETHFEQGSSRK